MENKNSADVESGLIEEARKYKNAEEFVKAQTTKDYVSEVKPTILKADDRSVFKTAGEARGNAREITNKEIEIAQRDQKIFDTNKNKSIEQLQKEISESKKFAEENNTSYPRSIQVKEEIIKTKSQLTDLYNQATAPQPKSSPIGKDVRPDVPQGKTDPLEALKAEARKYKSAEEFIKAKLPEYKKFENDADFTKYHITGIIPSSAYKDYGVKGGLDFFGKTEKNPILVKTLKIGDENISFRKRNNKDTAISVINSKNEVIGGASNEFGADGVWIINDYQGKGIGTKLLREFRKQFSPDRKIGQATESGYMLAKKYYKELESEASKLKQIYEQTNPKPIVKRSADVESGVIEEARKLGKYDNSYDVVKGKELYRGGSEDGVFWTDDIDIAKSFGDEGVIKKKITIKKPLDVRSKDIREFIKNNSDINIDDATSAYSRSLPEFKKLMKWAKERGYDGIIGKTSDNGLNFTGNEFVVIK